MGKRLFLVFLAVVGLMIAGTILFLQSDRFAGIVKSIVARHVPDTWGIQGDFTDFRIGLFPPAVSVRNPSVTVAERNILGLPEGSWIQAERIDLRFYPLQIFSGNIRVHEAAIVNGRVRLTLDPAALAKQQQKKKSGWKISWEDLLQIRAEAVSFENTQVELAWVKPKVTARFNARSLKASQWSASGGRDAKGFELKIDLDRLEADFPGEWKLPRSLDRVKAEIRLTASGVEVRGVSLESGGVWAAVDGQIKGNLLDPKSLPIELELDLKADALKLAELVGWSEAPKHGVAGRVRFRGKVAGDLLRLMATIRATGQLEASDMRFRDWAFDQASAKGRWVAPGGALTAENGGEIVVESAELSARATPRAGSRSPGHGGRISLGAFRVPLGRWGKVSVPLRLENAHLHWLAAPATREVYPLDLRIDGQIQAQFSPPREVTNAKGRIQKTEGWKLEAGLQLQIPHFQLDNQRLGVDKPLAKVLSFPGLRLSGEIQADAQAVGLKGVQISVGEASNSKSVFQADGKIDFKSGYDLTANGSIDFSDIRELAEVPIQGGGKLLTRIHGPSSRVRVVFDADLKETQYLGLSLGDLKGKITWDDDPQHVLFDQVKLQKGLTSYVGDGRLEVGQKDLVALGFKIKKGDIFDLSAIFEKLTSDLWWFPSSLSGEIQGEIDVTGGLRMSQLKVLGRLRGTEWDFYGEKFRTVTLSGGYDRGKYFVDEARATKYRGGLSGRISYGEAEGMDWSFQTEGLSLTDLDHIASLDVPIRGALSVQSAGATAGQGQNRHVRSTSRFALKDLVVRGAPVPPSDLLLSTADGMLYLKGKANGGEGNIDLSYSFAPGGKSALRLQLQKLDFSPFLLLMNPGLITDRDLTGIVSASIDLAFNSGQMELSTGKIDVEQYLLAKTGYRLELVDPLALRINAGTFAVDSLRLRGNQGEALLAVRARSGMLDGDLSGSVDLTLLEFFSSMVERTLGTVDLDLSIGGKIKEPSIVGQAYVRSGQIGIQSFDSPFENLTGTLHLKDGVLSLRALESRLAGGRAVIDGKAEFFVNKLPKLDLSAALQDNRIKVFPFQFAKTTGKITVQGESLPYQVGGTVQIDSALIKEKVFQQRSSSRKALKYTPPQSALYDRAGQVFELKINAKSEGGILIQNDLFDAEVKGDVTVVNTIAVPRVVGVIELVRGRLSFKDRHFTIDSARVDFDNPTMLNPKFDLNSHTMVNNTKIQMYAAGRLYDWKINLSSDPALPEPEILQLLAVGFTSGDLQRFGSQDQSALQQGEAASLLLHSFDFNRDVRDKTGFEIEVGGAVNTNVGSSLFRPQSESDATAAPKIVIKRKIGKRVDLTVGSTVGVGTTSERQVSAEVQMTPGMSVIGVWNSFESLNSQEEAQTSYGVDLKFQKRFK